MCKNINLSKPYCFSAYMSGSSSPSTSSATTIYQLSSLPPPSTLSDASIDTDLLKPPGEHRGTFYRLWQQPQQQQICVRAVNARQLLVTLLCCVQCVLCWKLCADD